MVTKVSVAITSCILYPVIACLYVCDGGTHDKVIEVGETAMAVSVGVVVSCGFAEASVEGLVPIALIAETR
jgi:hypothetical protein